MAQYEWRGKELIMSLMTVASINNDNKFIQSYILSLLLLIHTTQQAARGAIMKCKISWLIPELWAQLSASPFPQNPQFIRFLEL